MRLEAPHIEISLHTLETHPSVRELRTALTEKQKLSPEVADHFINRLLRSAMGDLAERYSGEMTTRLKRIMELRSKLHRAIGEVVGGKPLPPEVTPESLAKLFDDLQKEMMEVKSPSKFVDGATVDPFKLDVGGERGPTVPEDPKVQAGMSKWYSGLEAKDQKLMTRATQKAGPELASMMTPDDTGSFTGREDNLRAKLAKEGFSKTAIDRVVSLAKAAQKERELIDAALNPPPAVPSKVPSTGPKTKSTGSGKTPVVPPRGTVNPPQVRVDPYGRIEPGQWTRNPRTGELVICNYAGLGHARQHFETELLPAIEVGIPGWHRAHAQGASLNESALGILYAPPEVNLGLQNSGIEQYMRDISRQLPPEARLVMTTATRAHPGSLRLAEVQYKLEIEIDGVRTRIGEAGITIENATVKPKIDFWADGFADVDQYLP